MTIWEFFCAQSQWVSMNVADSAKLARPEDEARVTALAEAMPQTLSE